DGGYICAGMTESGGEAMWLLRLGQDGSQLWSKTFGGASASGEGVAALTDGGFALVGSRHVDSYKDAWIVRTDKAGELLWSKTFGTSNVDDEVGGALEVSGGLVFASEHLSSPG